MILDEYVDIGLSARNMHYYESLGYEIPRKRDSKGRTNYTKGTKINVKVADLLPTSNIKVKCKCESCGKERYVQYNSLMHREGSVFKETGETLCTKCRNERNSGENSPKYKHGCDRYCEYKVNARRRGISFELSPDEFKYIINRPCHYCGGYSKDYDDKSRGNGIDRKDSKIGYHISNCVPCCSRCNFIKNTMSYEELIRYIKRLYKKVCENENT